MLLYNCNTIVISYKTYIILNKTYVHRCAIAIASHENPVRFLAFGSGRKKIRSLIMLPQYYANFLVAIAPKEKNSEKAL